jgi:hypothetical protein
VGLATYEILKRLDTVLANQQMILKDQEEIKAKLSEVLSLHEPAKAEIVMGTPTKRAKEKEKS